MKVKFGTAPHKKVEFSEIKESDMFGYNSRGAFHYYMKMGSTSKGNCIDLEDAYIMDLDPDTSVTPLNGELNVWY